MVEKAPKRAPKAAKPAGKAPAKRTTAKRSAAPAGARKRAAPKAVAAAAPAATPPAGDDADVLRLDAPAGSVAPVTAAAPASDAFPYGDAGEEKGVSDADPFPHDEAGDDEVRPTHAGGRPAGAETAPQLLEPEPVAVTPPDPDAPVLPEAAGTAHQRDGPLLRPTLPRRAGASLPEQFLMFMVEPGWDSRREAFPDGLGLPLAGAMLLDLALHGELRLQADRFHVKDVDVAQFQPLVQELRRLERKDADRALFAIARKASRLAEPWKDRLAAGGVLSVRRTSTLGLWRRTELAIADATAVERFRSRVMRGLAGGGPLDAQEILLLGIVDAAGLLGEFVPSTAVAYNHKRIQGLMAGRDRLDYRMDQKLRSVQRDLLEFVLRKVKAARIGT